MSLREEFVRLAEQQQLSFQELCERYQISRKTGYKWLKRYASQGMSGLANLSRRPRKFPNQLSDSEEKPIVELRGEHARSVDCFRATAWSGSLPRARSPECFTVMV